MPIRKVKGECYRVENTTTKKCMSKTQAEKQLRAIKANQQRRGRK